VIAVIVLTEVVLLVAVLRSYLLLLIQYRQLEQIHGEMARLTVLVAWHRYQLTHAEEEGGDAPADPPD
jgi:hypothetical protein